MTYQTNYVSIIVCYRELIDKFVDIVGVEQSVTILFCINLNIGLYQSNKNYITQYIYFAVLYSYS